MANEFGIDPNLIGAPPTLGGSAAPVFQQVDTNQPGVIDQLKVAWTDFATKLKDDPDFNQAVLQFGAGALQPRAAGVSELGHLAGTFAGAAGNLKAVRERKSKEKSKAETAERAEVRSEKTLELQTERVGLEGERLEEQKLSTKLARGERAGIREEGAEKRELEKEKLSVQIKRLREDKDKPKTLLEIEASARAAQGKGTSTAEQDMIVEIKNAQRAQRPLNKQKIIIESVTRAKIEHENNPLKRGILFDDAKAVRDMENIYDLSAGKETPAQPVIPAPAPAPAPAVTAIPNLQQFVAAPKELLTQVASDPKLLQEAIDAYGLPAVQQVLSQHQLVLRIP